MEMSVRCTDKYTCIQCICRMLAIFIELRSYHISNAILILRINEECASGYMRDKVYFFVKDDLTPVKCKSFQFPECKYETGYVFLYIENFRNRLSLLLHWRSTTPGYTRDKLTP